MRNGHATKCQRVGAHQCGVVPAERLVTSGWGRALCGWEKGAALSQTKGWADVNSAESIQGSSSEWWKASLPPPLTYSQGPPPCPSFLQTFLLCSAFPPNHSLPWFCSWRKRLRSCAENEKTTKYGRRRGNLGRGGWGLTS